jgi:hypothetical protein
VAFVLDAAGQKFRERFELAGNKAEQATTLRILSDYAAAATTPAAWRYSPRSAAPRPTGESTIS